VTCFENSLTSLLKYPTAMTYPLRIKKRETAAPPVLKNVKLCYENAPISLQCNTHQVHVESLVYQENKMACCNVEKCKSADTSQCLCVHAYSNLFGSTASTAHCQTFLFLFVFNLVGGPDASPLSGSDIGPALEMIHTGRARPKMMFTIWHLRNNLEDLILITLMGPQS
jgi:hypothetical protein